MAAGRQEGSTAAGAAIQGKVVDASSRPVEGAKVRVQASGASTAMETTSGAGGAFRIANLIPGTYTVTAESGHLRAQATIVSVRGDGPALVLVLGPANVAGTGNRQANGFAQAMEFADKPDFTVAGVTDWTAAGGHGSDVNLRASEALVTETVRLKPGENAKTAPPGATAAHADSTDAAHAAEIGKRESDLRAAVADSPNSFEANHNLAELYLSEKRYGDAIGPLVACFRIDRTNRDNESELALALKENGQFAEARSHIEDLLAQGGDAALHRLGGEVDESLGDPLAAVGEFEAAARIEPSEENYFAWGSELILHRAILQAREVFARGVEAYPASVRMLTALGTALFAGAHYDEAAQRLCAASDLDPDATEPYLFLGKIVVAAPNPLPCATPRLKRFSAHEPANPLASYYYAMALWKEDGQPANGSTAAQVEALLDRAVSADAKCGDAWLELGVMSLSRKEYGKAIDDFQKAVAADPRMSEAHYRLGVAYDRVGERDKAKQEFDLHEQIDREQKEEVERERRAVKQFRVIEPARGSDSQP
jgi:tetratricopeptide (TPR) repeat protein